MTSTEDYLRSNLNLWDQRVPVHLETAFYGMDAFREGACSLTHIEREALGDVSGRSLLHLQCHFGQDSLSLARRGARVTGVDFSPQAVATARSLNQQLGLSAEFVESSVYDLPVVLAGTFELVFTSYGVLKWLPDIDRWAEVVGRYLAPGGTFFMVEFHPLLYVFDYERAERIEHGYFTEAAPITYDEVGTYADANLPNPKKQAAYAWSHPVSRVISALIARGLILEQFTEYPYSTLDCFPFVVRQEAEKYVHHSHPGKIPMLYALKCRRPF